MPTDMGSLEALAATVSSTTSALCSFLRENDHPQPSFSPSSPVAFPTSQAPEAIIQARNSLIAAARQLHFLALWPTEAAQYYAAYGAHDTASLRWLYHFKVHHAVPLEPGSETTFSEIAQKCDVDERRLTRIMRHAMTNHWFEEPEPGRVTHSAMSRLIVTDEAVNGQVGYQTEVVFPSTAKTVEATESFGRSEKRNNAAFNVAWQTNLQSMVWAAEDPVKVGWFSGLMKGYQRSSQMFNLSSIVEGYDWVGLGEGLVVDVGGNTGTVSQAIAKAAPKLKFIVQDQPAAVARGRAELPLEMMDRIAFHEHDFFTPNPVQSPDIYLLRFILHDWPDEDAIAILRNLLPSMGTRTKLIIADAIVPPPKALPYTQEKHMRTMDITIMTMMNAMERTSEDWQTLIESIDPSLKILDMRIPKTNAISIIEVVKV